VSQYADWRLLVTLIAVAACLVLLGMERLLFYKGSLNRAPEEEAPASPAPNK
jgi:predicted MFS family arabinose efflux permease